MQTSVLMIRIPNGATSGAPVRRHFAGLIERLKPARVEKFLANTRSWAETQAHALDVLLVAGGPAVRFSIADPVDGLGSFDLAPSDYATFDAALNKATTALSE